MRSLSQLWDVGRIHEDEPMSDDVKSYTREQMDALNLTALVNTLIDTAKEETRDLLRMGSPTRAIRDARADAEFRLHGVLAMLRATARAGLADTERLDWLEQNSPAVPGIAIGGHSPTLHISRKKIDDLRTLCSGQHHESAASTDTENSTT